MPELGEWDSFYVIVAPAAAGLIGLQFVIMTLIAERPSIRAAEASAAFSTPTIVHFSTVLLLGALLRAPWPTVAIPSVLCALIGLMGVTYEIIVMSRMRGQKVYDPVFEDWLCHFILPLASYALLAFSGIEARTHLRAALFGLGGASLMLLFTGIHNAWDAVAYHVFVSRLGGEKKIPPASDHRQGK
jgi:hypothetical protein